jgi:CHASE1-domain containing sensor protein
MFEGSEATPVLVAIVLVLLVMAVLGVVSALFGS